MAEARFEKHLELSRRISSMLLNKSFRDSLPRQESGERAIVAASTDELAIDILRSIDKIGLPLTLCVAAAPNSFTVIDIGRSCTPDHLDIIDLKPDMTVGVLVALLWQTGQPVHLHLSGEIVNQETKYDLQLA
ncbi:MAG: hypothetical protein ACRDJF_13415 [Actinomycetota bacterium]